MINLIATIALILSCPEGWVCVQAPPGCPEDAVCFGSESEWGNNHEVYTDPLQGIAQTTGEDESGGDGGAPSQQGEGISEEEKRDCARASFPDATAFVPTNPAVPDSGSYDAYDERGHYLGFILVSHDGRYVIADPNGNYVTNGYCPGF